ncbi:Rpn family recombination-promoting nuclease/putative transposase [Laspinema olomoucense]|uniref:Rpn family recombination-promoting nuclease/putative transposase n=1 Tax=Laspinema olomoucense D3b TaxID=2953688 RepID=A0ABT2N8X6_9CYAN|nr:MULTISPECIES: Rpn family recombination-promoting nuclease/putative transposase [unclassified Laspinema]MCT7979150.1 Rpn family recombination-promoting nuclease/putative transposase [Laspinema sp. D3b]MCT7992910.1 Rpn family recombination-promoting nuclease/putative transposase [Laspinema sp. D3c]
MPIDNLCKYLAAKYPQRFAAWRLGTPISSPVKVLKTELTLEPIRADSVIFLQTEREILHLEFQVKVPQEQIMPLRMLNYWVRLYWQYRLPVRQVIIWLQPTRNPAVFETEFQFQSTRHGYEVVRMWEEPPEPLLQDPALLPLAVLSATEEPNQLLGQVAQEVAKIEETELRQEIAACTQVLAGLRFNKDVIANFFREEIMQESVIYQDILQKGLEQGLEQGLNQGKKQEAIALIQGMLNRRFGSLEPHVQERLESLTLTQLEELSLALFDLTEVTDLVTWLQSR